MREPPHPDVVRLLERFRADRVPTYDAVGVMTARAILENVTRLQSPATEVAVVRDLLVQGAAGLLPARIYDPDPSEALPLVIYFHGGGWALGSVRAADRPCRQLAREAGCVVASVEYRRAPETQFPGPLLDCVAATRWLVEHAVELGADARAVAVMGDSAGGNLATATAQLLGAEERSVLAAQILLYPCLAPVSSNPDASAGGQAPDGPLMTRRELEWFWDLYLDSEADARDARAVPLIAELEQLSVLPPTAIVLAGLDPLRDEGLAYAHRLREAGVPVSVSVYPGAAHGFWWMNAEMRQANELTHELAAQIIALRDRQLGARSDVDR